jgi:hypothetical protein
MAKICGVMLLLLVGCGKEVVVDIPAEKPVDVEAFISSVDTQAKALATTLAAQKLTGEQTLEAAQAIMAKLNTLEASLVVPKAGPGKEDDQQSAPESPAKANTQQALLKVATPGTSSETLTELATRLYSQGVSVHMKTEDQLRTIDAQLNGGQPVTGGIFQNNRPSAVASQRPTVRPVSRGRGVVRWQRNTSQQTCGPNGCY